MKTAMKTATTTVLSVNDIDSSAITSFRFMGDNHVGTLEVKFQSMSDYRYLDVPFEKVLAMSALVNAGESLGSYFSRNIRTNYQYELVR